MIPTEAQEGDILVAYLRTRGIAFTHIPNETGHDEYSKRRAVRMKRQGVSKGFPDYVIALPGVGVLYIELKRRKKSFSRVSPEQQTWVNLLTKCPGSESRICYGADESIKFIEELVPGTAPLPHQNSGNTVF